MVGKDKNTHIPLILSDTKKTQLKQGEEDEYGW